jgi:hypothetical protein
VSLRVTLSAYDYDHHIRGVVVSTIVCHADLLNESEDGHVGHTNLLWEQEGGPPLPRREQAEPVGVEKRGVNGGAQQL